MFSILSGNRDKIIVYLRNMAIAAIVIAASGLVAWQMMTMNHPEIALLFAAVLLVVVIGVGRGSLQEGVLAIILTALFVRFTLPTGTATRVPMSLVLTAGVIFWWFVHNLSVRGKLVVAPSKLNLPLFGFLAIAGVSFFWSNTFRDPSVRMWPTWPYVQLAGLAILYLLPLIMLLAANQFRNVQWLRHITIVFVVCGSVSIVGTYFNLPYFNFIQVRPLFSTWVICLAISLALFNRRMNSWLRVFLVLLCVAWFYDMFIVRFRWLSSWVPTLAAGLVLVSFRSKKLLAALVLVLVVFSFYNLATLRTGIQQEWEGSTLTRFDAWAHNWQVTKEHPLLGVGPAGYAIYYMTYFPSEAMATHNNYIDVFAQTGAIGFLFFAWMLGIIGIQLWRSLRATQGRGDFIEAFSFAVFGGFVAVLFSMMLGDWIFPFIYTQTLLGFDYAVYSWVMLGAGIALWNHLRFQMEEECDPQISPSS